MNQMMKQREQYEILIRTLIDNGETEVALEMQKLTGIDPNQSAIPLFGEVQTNDSENFETYSELFSIQKSRQFGTEIIDDGDISIIEEGLNYPDQMEIPYDNIDFDSLKRQIGEIKCKYIFSDTILRKFTSKSNQIFISNQYLTFLKIYSRIKNAKNDLIQYDSNLSTTINLDILRLFIEDYSQQIESLKPLYDQKEYFREYYIEIISSIFFFYLSPIYESKAIDIYDLLSSNLFYNYIFMDEIHLDSNPVSISKTYEIYELFMKLDTQKEGLLVKENIKKIDNIIFTDVTLSRIFDFFQLYQQKVDIYLFMNIVLSIRHLLQPNATKLFFQIVDLDCKGVIDRSDILYFYKGMIEEVEEIDVPFDYFLSQLLDIIGCSSETISEDVLVKSKKQDTFFKLLLDINTFKSEMA